MTKELPQLRENQNNRLAAISRVLVKSPALIASEDTDLQLEKFKIEHEKILTEIAAHENEIKKKELSIKDMRVTIAAEKKKYEKIGLEIEKLSAMTIKPKGKNIESKNKK